MPGHGGVIRQGAATGLGRSVGTVAVGIATAVERNRANAVGTTQRRSFDTGDYHAEEGISASIVAGVASLTVPTVPTPRAGIGLFAFGIDADTGDVATVLGNTHILLVGGNGSLPVPVAVGPLSNLSGQTLIVSVPGATSGTCSLSLFYPT